MKGPQHTGQAGAGVYLQCSKIESTPGASSIWFDPQLEVSGTVTGLGAGQSIYHRGDRSRVAMDAGAIVRFSSLAIGGEKQLGPPGA